MKLYLTLISALLLLVPLVSAESVATMLYSNNGTHDFLILNGDNWYSFISEYTEYYNELSIRMLARDLLKKGNISLVVDWHPDGDGRSSESLIHLIKRIGKQVIVREPKEEEQKKLEEYKQRQTSKSNFKIVYQKRKFSIEACGLSLIDVTYSGITNSTQTDFGVRAWIPGHLPESSHLSVRADEEIMKNASFVIEHHSGRKRSECDEDEVVGLKPWYCWGEIALRSLD